MHPELSGSQNRGLIRGFSRIFCLQPTRLKPRVHSLLFWLICACLESSWLAGCNGAATPAPASTSLPGTITPSVQPTNTRAPENPAGKPTLYVPPSAVPGATQAGLLPGPTASPTGLAEPVLPTVTPTCTNDLLFLEDLTIPDGTKVAPGALIDKRWQVQNSGTCNWDERYSLRLFNGPSLSAPETQALFPARGGAQAVIRMLLTAPVEPGSYRSAWQAYDAQGQPFGQPVFIQIVVQAVVTP